MEETIVVLRRALDEATTEGLKFHALTEEAEKLSDDAQRELIGLAETFAKLTIDPGGSYP